MVYVCKATGILFCVEFIASKSNQESSAGRHHRVISPDLALSDLK